MFIQRIPLYVLISLSCNRALVVEKAGIRQLWPFFIPEYRARTVLGFEYP